MISGMKSNTQIRGKTTEQNRTQQCQNIKAINVLIPYYEVVRGITPGTWVSNMLTMAYMPRTPQLPNNQVQIALSQGVRSVWCNPKDPDNMIAELLQLDNSHDRIGYGGGGGGSSDYRRNGTGECAP